MPGTYAAVDLGSNSFHMIVARHEHGELRVIDRIKEMVRLAGGLDGHGRLNPAARSLALDCLARFGQRLGGIPDENIRAVGTQTLRKLRNSQAFLVVAETALGAPIDIISGREEARLVYQGVRQGLGDNGKRRLIIDIGGGSTEFVIGAGDTPELAESISFGCVGLTRETFPDGRVTRKRWKQARRKILAELREIALACRGSGWQEAIGSSGTNRAILGICEAAGWCRHQVTAQALASLREAIIDAGDIERLTLPGLSSRREPVIAGGALMLDACFEALGMDSMAVSDFALREGLLHDMLGRLEHTDPRDQSIEAMVSRYGVDSAQATRVRDIALTAYEQVAEDLELKRVHRDLLEWVCRVHEAGLAIAHTDYPAHAAYLLQHADMPGFTRQEQQFMAVLARHQRGKLNATCLDDLPPRLQPPCRRLLPLLRLAVILCRGRRDTEVPDFGLAADDKHLRLSLPAGWLESHPLTAADLESEQAQLKRLGTHLKCARLDPPVTP